MNDEQKKRLDAELFGSRVGQWKFVACLVEVWNGLSVSYQYPESFLDSITNLTWPSNSLAVDFGLMKAVHSALDSQTRILWCLWAANDFRFPGSPEGSGSLHRACWFSKGTCRKELYFCSTKAAIRRWLSTVPDWLHEAGSLTFRFPAWDGCTLRELPQVCYIVRWPSRGGRHVRHSPLQMLPVVSDHLQAASTLQFFCGRMMIKVAP